MSSATMTLKAEADEKASIARPDEPFQVNLNQRLMCPDCREDPPNLVEEFSSGDMVCGSCGLVLGDRIIDTRSEWRTFANDDQGSDDPSRVGDAMNPLLNGSQLETFVAFGEGGRSRELHRAQNRTQNNDKSGKNLQAAYGQIGNFCDQISVNKTIAESAKHIFKLVDDAKVLKGKSQEVIVASCIFIACRQAGAPRTFREIFNLTNVSKKEIGRTFKLVEKFLQATQEGNAKGSFLQPLDNVKSTKSTSAEDLCGRFCASLSFNDSFQMEKVSKVLANRSSAIKDIAGRSPLSVAAACIFMASHLMREPKSSKDIASVAGVSDGTIKTSYRFLLAAKDELITKESMKEMLPKGWKDLGDLPA